MSVPFLYVNGSLTMVLNGNSKTVGKDHPNFKAIRNGLKDKTDDELLQLVSGTLNEERAKVNLTATSGKVVIANGTVLYDGKEVETCLTEEIVQLQGSGMPIQGMLRFIERLYGNMSKRARTELLSFIQRNGLTIDSEGYLIAYKAVKENYMDKWTGKISYAIGNEVKMDRADVDDDFDVACSGGLHAGSLEYIYQYGSGSDRIVIVRIDPADVVCIPKDSECRKIRTCCLIVIGDYNGKLKQTVYYFDQSVTEMYEDDLDAEDEDDDYDWSDVEDDDEDDEAIDDFITLDEVSVISSTLTTDGGCCGGSQLVTSDSRSLAIKPAGDVDLTSSTIDRRGKSFARRRQLTQECCDGNSNDSSNPSQSPLGIKPIGSSQAGRAYHNKRGANGRFA